MEIEGTRFKRSRTDDSGNVGTDPAPEYPMLDEDERIAAAKFARIAEMAEQKALMRIQQRSHGSSSQAPVTNSGSTFLSKAERERLALEKLQRDRELQAASINEAKEAHTRFITGRALEERKQQEKLQAEKEELERQRRLREENKEAKELDSEAKAIRDHHLGLTEKKRKILKPSEKFARVFQFEWEQEDDTSRNDVNPLYTNRVKVHSLFGRGYVAGVDQRDQRKGSNFLVSLTEKRLAEIKSAEAEMEGMTEAERLERIKARQKMTDALRKKYQELDSDNTTGSSNSSHWSNKALENMTDRDWRIFREDFDIRIQGGRATVPLRNWQEANFPDPVMRAITDAGYAHPSPIQRQAIPVGQNHRDIIGIAETGSGKTAAFTIPLLCFLMSSPKEKLERCNDEGPIGMIMAPTRELAQQIYEECLKLAKHTNFSACCVVGGQDIEQQGFKLRQGVHIVIGTPGRLCDCLQNNYLVLNQCCYVVLDEADRMVDMGFEKEVTEVLDAMGGLLKSEDEEIAEQQLKAADTKRDVFRVTAMFSATMPTEVERIAKTYLRHPVIIKIGDEDSGKNKRIEQRVLFITEAQKKSKMLSELKALSSAEKAIVFVNTKKQGDMIGNFLDSEHLYTGVLHGGRSQDQREETLEQFRKGSIQILVATDVAGRGLDIPDVSHVFNMDCPSKIESYCHRIGRTGRAGKHGVAVTFLTDGDTEIMFDMKNYLESTGASVPPQLARHPAAQAPVGTRDEKGNVVGQKRETTKFSNK